MLATVAGGDDEVETRSVITPSSSPSTKDAGCCVTVSIHLMTSAASPVRSTRTFYALCRQWSAKATQSCKRKANNACEEGVRQTGRQRKQKRKRRIKSIIGRLRTWLTSRDVRRCRDVVEHVIDMIDSVNPLYYAERDVAQAFTAHGLRERVTGGGEGGREGMRWRQDSYVRICSARGGKSHLILPLCFHFFLILPFTFSPIKY